MTVAWSHWPAPAKLNLFLHIIGRRDDGYHLLQTVFQLLDRGDVVRLRPRGDRAIVRVDPLPGVPAEDDLCIRAAHLLQRETGTMLGVDIALDKRLPLGGGLGGGSSDAASVLVGLNALWDTGLDEDALAALGLRLGADVPVFVRGRSAFAEGVGERLTPVQLPECWYVVVHPRISVATTALFQVSELTRNSPTTTISRFLSGASASNVFEPVVRARYPAVAAAFDWLGGYGRARLSGSGGCVFLDVDDEAAAARIVARCPDRFAAWIARGVDRSPLLAARDVFSAGASPSW